MNEKTIKVAGLTKELLADSDKLFPEKTPEINMDMKEIYFRIGQRSVVRFLHQQKKEQDSLKQKKKWKRHYNLYSLVYQT